MAKDGNITLTIHGLDAFNGEVDGEVFAEKFSAFMRGLAISDTSTNGERRHKFVIADLVKNTATARLQERTVQGYTGTRSSVDFMRDAVQQIRNDAPSARLLPAAFVQSVVTLNKGAEERFQFGEIKFDDQPDNVIRLDSFLLDKAQKVLGDIKKGDTANLNFAGVAYGSFDGVMKAVDLQAQTKRAVLRMTAGGMPIQCNITHMAVEEIGAALDKRIVAYGTAHYDGQGGLPRLLDIQKIDIVGAGQGLERWRGAFTIPDDYSDETWGDA